MNGFVTPARMCGVGLALSLLGGTAHAADLPTKAPPVPYVGVDDFWTRPYLFGDLGRTRLKEQGISLALALGDEAVTNLSGGARNASANAGQLWFEAKFDMAKLAGIQGGLIGVTLVDRFGKNLNTEAGIPALQLTNEVFGRGNILRLTEFYYQQKLFDDRLVLKGGRLPVGSDFFFGQCEFLNLTFCGGQPGNIQGGYIYNWPISQWGGVAHYNFTKEWKLSVGVYDADPNYLTTSDAGVYLAPGIPRSIRRRACWCRWKWCGSRAGRSTAPGGSAAGMTARRRSTAACPASSPLSRVVPASAIRTSAASGAATVS